MTSGQPSLKARRGSGENRRRGGEELGLYSAGTAAWFDQDVPTGGRLLVMYGSPLRILHANKLGSTTVVTDQTGAELEDQIAYPWGQTWTTAGLGYDRHFAGMKQFESPEQLYPTDFRKYNPALGRWMSPDPLAGDVTNPQSLNRYAYVLNNPVSNVDPSGLQTCTDDKAVSADFCADVVAKMPPSIDTSSVERLLSLSFIGVAGGGGGSSSSADKSKPCSQHGIGFGVSGGGNADAGLGVAGVTTTGGVGGGLFYSGQSGASAGAFEEGGAAAYFLKHVAAAPAQSSQPLSFLAFGGGGLSAFVTNAGSTQQLAGPFTTYSVNVGFGPFKFTAQFAYSNGTYVLSFGPPYTGAGLGLSVSRLTTNTKVLGSTCNSGG